MTTKTIKAILFASLMFAMILPFSAMNFVDAAPSNEIAKEPKAPTMKQMQANLDKTPRESHAPTYKKGQFPGPRDLSTSGSTTQGSGHESFGTELDVDTSSQVGVYSKNEVHDGVVSLKDDTYLYAPTMLPANYAPLEVVTFYVDEGWWTGMKEHVVIYDFVAGDYVWSTDFVIDSNFMTDYTLSVASSDWYYTYVYKSGSTWYVYIWDVTNTEWDLWDSFTGSGVQSVGWVAWEEFNFNGDCPTTLPEIKARDVQVYDGGWQDADSSYASEVDTGSVCGIDDATFQSDFDEWSVDD